MKIRMRVTRISEHFGPDGDRLMGFALVAPMCDENRAFWQFRPDALLELKFVLDGSTDLESGEYDLELTPVTR